MASGNHSAPTAEPSLSARPSASSTQGAGLRIQLKAHGLDGHPWATFGLDAWGQWHPLIQRVRAPTGSTLQRVTFCCPPAHEEEEGLLDRGVCPPRAHILSSRPASGSWRPQNSLPQGLEPAFGTSVSVFCCCKKLPKLHSVKQQSSLSLFFFFFFWMHGTACGILVP